MGSVAMVYRVRGARIRIIKGDITEQVADAIVNAANPSLMGGGGVDGAIHRRGGPSILEECRRIREREWPDGLPTGEAVITTGGNLKVRFVIHTVGPVWRGGDRGERKLLANAYLSSLKLAASRNLRTIAFPSISTGAYGFPIEEAAVIAIRTVAEFLEENDVLEEVILVLYTERALKLYLRMAESILGPSE